MWAYFVKNKNLNENDVKILSKDYEKNKI